MATGMVRGEKVKLDLEKIEKKDEIEIIAVVTGKNGPVRDVRLAFFLNNRPVDEPQDTDPFGRIAVTLSSPVPGEYKFMAQALDGDLNAIIPISIKKQVAPSPASFFVETMGKDGEKRISVSVLTAKKDGCPDAVGYIAIDEFGGDPIPFTTDKRGRAFYPPLDQPPLRYAKELNITVSVDGVEGKAVPLRLPKPRRKIQKPEWYENAPFFARVWWQLRHNNNARAIIFWILAPFWLGYDLHFLFTGTPLLFVQSPVAEQVKTKESPRALDRDLEELDYQLGIVRTPKAPESKTATPSYAGWLWDILLYGGYPFPLFCLFYTFWALRDEVAEGWRAADKAVREKRSGSVKEPEQREGKNNPSSGVSSTTDKSPLIMRSLLGPRLGETLWVFLADYLPIFDIFFRKRR